MGVRLQWGAIIHYNTDNSHVHWSSGASTSAETTVMLDLGLAQPPPFPAAPIIDDGPSPAPSSPGWKAWTGASLLVGSAAALVADGPWLAVDNNGRATRPPARGDSDQLRAWETDARTPFLSTASLDGAPGKTGAHSPMAARNFAARSEW